ncbi:MAG: enoyl-CoA hydratase [Polyangiaceae bacterium]
MSEAPYVLKTEREGGVTLTLNRGDRFNPLSVAMIAALEAELDAIPSQARIVVLAAAGKGFCAGHDLKEMRAHAGDQEWQRELFVSCSRMMMKLTRLPQPVIARVHGIATAAGCQLVATCDLAVASADAKFALPGVNVGVFCSTPAVAVVRSVGRKRAMEMLLTGEPIDATRALEWGLINRVAPREDLDSQVERLAASVVAKSGAVIGIGKRAFYEQVELGLEDAYRETSEAMSCNLMLDDASEGIDAFLGKRAPAWRHR